MRIIYTTTIGLTMNFFKSIIKELVESGHTVDIATNEMDGQFPVDDYFKKLGCTVFPISWVRKPLSLKNYRAIGELKEVLKNGYDIVHCHTPIAAACTRLAYKSLRDKGTKLIYTAHGFHFYKGSSFLSWATFYPIEKWLSNYTDLLITINNEDYSLAKRKFKSKKIVYVPGVGIDTKLFREITIDRNEKRLEIGVKAEEILILSVGELSVRKNHMVILDAIIHLEDNVKYYIVGQGQLKEIIERRAKELGISNRVKLLGYRNDIKELLWAADIFAFPSLQEGLPVALMEAAAAGIPLVASDIRGNNDIVRNGENGYLVKVNNSKEYEYAFKNIINGELKNLAKVKLKEEYDIKNINKIMREYYLTI